VRICH